MTPYKQWIVHKQFSVPFDFTSSSLGGYRVSGSLIVTTIGGDVPFGYTDSVPVGGGAILWDALATILVPDHNPNVGCSIFLTSSTIILGIVLTDRDGSCAANFALASPYSNFSPAGTFNLVSTSASAGYSFNLPTVNVTPV
jgi:hypothetical protein